MMLTPKGNAGGLGWGWCAVIAAVLASPAAAREVVTLGPSDGITLDQPRVRVEVFDPDTGASLGPNDGWLYTPNVWLLDTGAQGVVAAGIAVEDLNAAGYETEAVFLEQGVAGYTVMDISAPYDVTYQPVSGDDIDWDDWFKSGPMRLDDVRLLSSATADFGGYGGIMGMPGMLGQAVTVDNTQMLTALQLGVEFNPSVPAGAGHRYRFPLHMEEFPPTGQVEPDDPLPTYAPLPMVTVEAFHGDRASGGRWLLDTGAQMSMISSRIAFDLGLDTDGDGTFDEEALEWIQVGGVGGSALVPVLAFDQIRISDGTHDLVTTGMQVLVVDIDEAIDGVFGMELMTSGWGGALFGEGTGQLDRVHFDFTGGPTGPAGLVYDVADALDTPVTVDTQRWTGPAEGMGDWSDPGRWQLAEPNAREDAELVGQAGLGGAARVRRLRIGRDGLGSGRLEVEGGMLSAMRVVVGDSLVSGELSLSAGGTVRADLGVEVAVGSTLSGGGTILGEVTNAGTMRLAGGETLAIEGDLVHGGILELTWSPGGDPNSAGLVVAGRAEVQGTIHLRSGADQPGERMTVLLAEEIVGQPAAMVDPAGPAGLWYQWQVDGSAGQLVSAALGGDATLDGVVDVGDLAVLAAHWGTAEGASWSQADFNGDGAVDVGDLGVLASHWGAKATVPEPGSLSILLVWGMVGWVRRRR